LLQPLALPGDFKFADVNNDGAINDNDRTYIGNPHPDLFFGFNLNFGYKNFDLSSSFNGTVGNDMWNEHLAKYFVSIDNVPADAYTKAWRQQGDDTRFPRISQTNKNNNNRSSSWYVEDGSFVRLKNLQLGYTLPSGMLSKSHLFSSCRIYLSGQNLLTFTNYTGMDPEVGNGSPIQQGFEITRYPASKIVSFGINAQF
jgi:TonB-dependent starch-binding outer membrane protein SusC